jgi:hypothetical protein
MSNVVMASLSLIAFGAGLVSVCLPGGYQQPAYYDGDEDDVGLAQDRQTLAPGIAIAQTAVQLAVLPPFHRDVAQSSSARAHVSSPRLSESRGPPA